MKFSEIDYMVYQYVFEAEQEFVDYLKSENDGGLVKNYSLSPYYTVDLIERISKKYDFKLVKLQDKNYQCFISGEEKEGYAESKLLSMALCLSILDLFGKKELYIDEAEKLIQEMDEKIAANKERLRTIGIDYVEW